MPKTKKNVIVLLILLMFLTIMFLLLSPGRFRPPSRHVLEVLEYERMQSLSTYIKKFEEKENRLPKDFQELALNLNIQELVKSKLGEPKRSLSEISIIDFTDKSVIFEVESAWVTNDGYLIWIRTKDGVIIKVLKDAVGYKTQQDE